MVRLVGAPEDKKAFLLDGGTVDGPSPAMLVYGEMRRVVTNVYLVCFDPGMIGVVERNLRDGLSNVGSLCNEKLDLLNVALRHAIYGGTTDH